MKKEVEEVVTVDMEVRFLFGTPRHRKPGVPISHEPNLPLPLPFYKFTK